MSSSAFRSFKPPPFERRRWREYSHTSSVRLISTGITRRIVESLRTNDEMAIELPDFLDAGRTSPILTAQFAKAPQYGHWVAAGSEKGEVFLIDTTVPTELKRKATCRNFQAHQNAIFDLSWSSSGKELATACGDRTVRLFDVQRLTLKAAFEGHAMTVKTVEMHPWGADIFVSGGREGCAILWDTRARPSRQAVVEFVSSSSRRPQTLQVDEVPHRATRHILCDLMSPYRFANTAPMAETDASVKKRRRSSRGSPNHGRGQRPSTPVTQIGSGKGSITSIRFIDDHHFATTSSLNGIVKFWDTRMTRRQLTEVSCLEADDGGRRSFGVTSMALSQDRTTMVLATSSSKVIVIPKLYLAANKVESVALSTSCMRPRASTSSSSKKKDPPSTFCQNAFHTPQPATRRRFHISPYFSGRTGRRTFDGGLDEELLEQDHCAILSGFDAGQQLYMRASVSPSGRYVCCGSSDGSCRVWDIARPHDSPMVLPAVDGEILGAEWCPNDPSKLMAYGDNGIVRLWTPLFGKEESSDLVDPFAPLLWESPQQNDSQRTGANGIDRSQREPPGPSSSSPSSSDSAHSSDGRPDSRDSRLLRHLEAERHADNHDDDGEQMPPLSPPSIAAPLPTSDASPLFEGGRVAEREGLGALPPTRLPSNANAFNFSSPSPSTSAFLRSPPLLIRNNSARRPQEGTPRRAEIRLRGGSLTDLFYQEAGVTRDGERNSGSNGEGLLPATRTTEAADARSKRVAFAVDASTTSSAASSGVVNTEEIETESAQKTDHPTNRDLQRQTRSVAASSPMRGERKRRREGEGEEAEDNREGQKTTSSDHSEATVKETAPEQRRRSPTLSKRPPTTTTAMTEERRTAATEVTTTTDGGERLVEVSAVTTTATTPSPSSTPPRHVVSSSPPSSRRKRAGQKAITKYFTPPRK